MKKKMSNLPRDLSEEVLCRIPLTSLRTVRSICKNWNKLSKGMSFSKKYLGSQAKETAKEKEFMVVMMMDFKVYLMRVDLHNNNKNNVESCIKREGKLISLDNEVDVSQIFHCDGLLLCVTKDHTRLVVWNPYWGHTRWIEPTRSFGLLDRYFYALGYDKTNKSHKILRFIDFRSPAFAEFKIYDFNSDSWRVLDVTPDWRKEFYHSCVSLKGNAYFFAQERGSSDADDSFLVCFDFTREIFGPRLSVPIEFHESQDAVTLSSVRDEQLAVLYQPWDTLRMEIWVTTKIEPNAVSWNSKVFLSANIKQLIAPQFQFNFGSFFIDEEKEVAVVFDKDKDIHCASRNIAYIFGADGSFREADLGEAYPSCYPLVCSYVPSLVQLN